MIVACQFNGLDYINQKIDGWLLKPHMVNGQTGWGIWIKNPIMNQHPSK